MNTANFLTLTLLLSCFGTFIIRGIPYGVDRNYQSSYFLYTNAVTLRIWLLFASLDEEGGGP
jgi:hypothetical protein